MKKPVASVKGIGPVAAETLARLGITTVEELASTSVEQLSLAPGISAATSKRFIAEAGKILAAKGANDSEVVAGPAANSPDPEPAGKDTGNGKGKGKGKSKGRGKGKGKGKRQGGGKAKGDGGNPREKGSNEQGRAAGRESAISKKAAILIKVLTRQIEARKAKIAKHTRKLERLERALRKAQVKSPEQGLTIKTG